MNKNNAQGMGFSCKTCQVSIPRGGETLPVSLLQQQQNFPIATFTSSGSKDALRAGLAQDKLGKALCQTPPPAELPELFWAGCVQS